MLSYKKDLGHWKFNEDFDPDHWFGFLYCIENTVTKQFYLGKKQFRIQGKKRSKNYGKEHKWRSYVGSSEHLKKDIKLYDKDKFRFDMIELYRTRGGLNYVEAWCQMVSNSMTDCLDDEETPRWYNRQVAAIRWVPSETPTQRVKNYLKNLKRRY